MISEMKLSFDFVNKKFVRDQIETVTCSYTIVAHMATLAKIKKGAMMPPND
jgi:hypothetical protein